MHQPRGRWSLPLFLALIPVYATRAQSPAPLAAPARGSLEFAIDVGHTRYEVDGIRPDGSRLELFFGRHLTPRLAWTFDIACLGGTPAGAPESDSFSICTGSLGGQLEVGVMSRARPYLRASYGQAQLDWQAELDVFDIDERSGATTIAVGSRFALGRSGRYSLRTEASWARNDVLGELATHRSITLGIAYRMP